MKIRIIKKNDDYSLEYAVGDEFEVTGTWYGGVHINGKTGVPVSLDQDEYEVLTKVHEQAAAGCLQAGEKETDMAAGASPAGMGEFEEPDDPAVDVHGITEGSIVQHFKREWVDADTSEYVYKVLAFAHHTENGEKLVIYQGMYPPFKVCARPYAMFMSEVDREKYPDVKQKYRFELFQE